MARGSVAAEPRASSGASDGSDGLHASDRSAASAQAAAAEQGSLGTEAGVSAGASGRSEVYLGTGPGVRSTGRGRPRLGALLTSAGLAVDGYRIRLSDLEPLAELAHARGRLATDGSVEAFAELEHSQLPAAGGETHLVVRLRGGEVSRGARARMRVHLVIDRSSSMQSSWGDVLAAARAVVEQLGPDDEIQIVAYGTDAEEILPPSRVGNGRRAKRALRRIRVGGGTNIEAGLRVAYGAAARPSPEGSLVVLLSDGVPNGGAFTADELGPMAARARARFGCTTTVLGLGHQFDAEVLRAIAVAGRGGYLVARDASELGPMLRAEIGAQARVAARDLRLNVSLAPGVELQDVNDAAGVERSAGGVVVTLPQLRAGAERRVVLRLRVRPGAEAVARVELRYRGRDARAQAASKELGVRFGAEARRSGSVAQLAVFDADLGRALDAAATQVLRGHGDAAAEVLREHALRVEAQRSSGQNDAALSVRTRAVRRLAAALGSLVGSGSPVERREVSLAMGGLALRLQR